MADESRKVELPMPKKASKRGRPPKPESERVHKSVGFKLDSTVLALLDEGQARGDCTKAEALRRAIRCWAHYGFPNFSQEASQHGSSNQQTSGPALPPAPGDLPAEGAADGVRTAPDAAETRRGAPEVEFGTHPDGDLDDP